MSKLFWRDVCADCFVVFVLIPVFLVSLSGFLCFTRQTFARDFHAARHIFCRKARQYASTPSQIVDVSPYLLSVACD